LQPHFFTIEQSKRDSRKNGRKTKSEKSRNGTEELCAILTGGDITKRDDIVWGFTLEELKPYIDFKIRDVTFREAVLGFLGVKTKTDIDDAYCQACRQAGKDIDCANCSRDIEVKKENKAIGKK
jgi:hypothetical protein